MKLVADVPDDLNALETDPGKLKQVIINLVGNALRFTTEGAVTVEVETDPAGPDVPQRIHVHDTGPGIPQDRLDAIFEAFQQADSSTARKYGGTGLGLSISRSLCNLLGYHITVASVVDEGSTFTINLNTRIPAHVTLEPEDSEVPEEELGVDASDSAAPEAETA